MIAGEGGVPADILAREPTERGGGEARARQRVVVGWTPPDPVAALILLLRPKQPKGLSLGAKKKIVKRVVSVRSN